ncbi:calponin homology domain-containing protein [Thamnocephalis sphaerospora]|uniref:Calponin homology domain-containing protein n=1 Tax=Thamnocephalis sphaerospora TaxID=78915 RepID=A0A4P9XR62_9FUNG|nr:calponin homology domain-containing protein [Thamnocephalis sphaerospora]|eukprot:RKP08555.1 calponin homology domain-containing protein [Thamnocephalis sphaerospora]
MGESRNDLLAWINNLLQLNYTKIEQLGTGAAYCQIIDSIYRNVPLSKVKFNAKADYEYVANFKVLQNSFDRNKIEKSIPVDRLIKCKMQDNLEFTQWIKQYWDNSQGYDNDYSKEAADRRKNSPGAPLRPGSSARAAGARAPSVAGRSGRLSAASGRASPADHNAALVQDLTRQMSEMRVNVDGLEKERDFYFQKLRDVELLLQDVAAQEELPPSDELIQLVQNILYSTEEGFDAPEGGEEGYEEEVY